jgi:hypothetical protein
MAIVIACTVMSLAAGCAHVPTASQTVSVPPPARSIDVLDVAVAAAKSVGLPPATKLDRSGGVVEFGAFESPAAGYVAQVRRRPDGELDVTVKRGPGEVPGTVEDKARQFVAALDTRLRQVPPSRTAPTAPATPTPPPSSQPAPSSPPAPSRPPAAAPAAPAAPPAPPRQEPVPAPKAMTLIVSAAQANLRERADPAAKLIRVLPRNTRVTVLGKANQWYMVRLADGTEGWLAESAVSPAR